MDTAAGSLPEISPPSIPGGKKEIALPATVDDLDVGGGGRYIALHMKSLRKIAIFDVNELKITGYATGAGDDTKFAAGASKLVVVSGNNGIIARWDLATGKRELAQTIDLGGQVSQVLLGSASDGPAIVAGGNGRNGKGHVVDMKTLKSEPFAVISMRRGFGQRANFRISANGQVMGVWESGVSPSGLQTYIKSGDQWQGFYEHDSVGYVVPSPDGKRLYTARGIFTSQLRRIGEPQQSVYPIPAQHGPYYLTSNAKTISRNKTEEKVNLHLEGDSRPLATIPNLQPAWSDDDKWSRQTLSLDKRLILVPDANTIIQLDSTGQKLHAVHFDIDTALNKSDQSPVMTNVIISASSASGQQAYHTFNLNVDGGSTSTTPNAGPIAAGPNIGSIDTTEASLGGETKTIRMPGTISDVTLGSAGRFVFLHIRDLKKIAVFDVSQAKITGYLPAADDETMLVAGATRALVFSVSQGVVSRYRLDNLKRELTTTIPFTGKVSFAAMGASSEGPVMLRTSESTDSLSRCTFHLLDIKSMKPIDVNRISAVGGRLHRGFAWPAADGKHFFASGQMHNAEMNRIGDGSTGYGVAVPSITGRYFLSMPEARTSSSRSSSEKQSAKLYMFGDNRPLVTIPDLEVSSGNGNYGRGIGWEKRIHFVPDAKVIATIPHTNDRIILRKFDIDQALNESGVDYLIVDSMAPGEAKIGATYSYEVKVKSKRGGVKYSLDTGPEGMRISSRGLITWRVPRSVKEESHKVIASISDASGQSIFHTFSIEVPEVKLAKEAEARRLALQREQELAAQREAERNRLAELRRQPEERRERAEAVEEAGEEVVDEEVPREARAFPMRTWSGGDGKFKVTAKFVRIVDRRQVVLQLDSGIEMRIDLNKLTNEDIYEAVKSDLRR
eukprot:g14012.t1